MKKLRFWSPHLARLEDTRPTFDFVARWVGNVFRLSLLLNGRVSARQYSCNGFACGVLDPGGLYDCVGFIW